MTPGSSRRDCAPWEVTRKETPLPYIAWCSKMKESHIFCQKLPITGLQSLHHNFWHWERGRRIKKTTWESSTPYSPWRWTTGVDRKGLGVLLSASLDLLCTMKLILKQKVKFSPISGSLGCPNNKKSLMFNLRWSSPFWSGILYYYIYRPPTLFSRKYPTPFEVR